MSDYIFVTSEYLDSAEYKANISGFQTPKWILFCRACLDRRWSVRIKKAKTSYSRYILVRSNGIEKKIRFSNHKPNPVREESGDCDILVGAKNAEGRWINWEGAIEILEGILQAVY